MRQISRDRTHKSQFSGLKAEDQRWDVSVSSREFLAVWWLDSELSLPRGLAGGDLLSTTGPIST